MPFFFVNCTKQLNWYKYLVFERLESLLRKSIYWAGYIASWQLLKVRLIPKTPLNYFLARSWRWSRQILACPTAQNLHRKCPLVCPLAQLMGGLSLANAEKLSPATYTTSTLCLRKKRHPFYFRDNLVRCHSILPILDRIIPQGI